MNGTKTKPIPYSLQGVLWSADVNKLDLEKDKDYIIHQTLCYGGLDEIRWLFKTYPKKEITRTFVSTPYKDYFPARFHYVKNIVLNLDNQNLDPRHYVKNIPRHLG